MSSNRTAVNEAILNGANVNIIYTNKFNFTPLIAGKKFLHNFSKNKNQLI